MACEVCEHCQGSVCREQAVIRKGFSYHKKCHKCYVCSETNLTNADVFKGVIFCSGCSQRIFQGCSTAKRTKNTKPKRQRSRSHRRRDRARTQDRNANVQNGIIELAGLVGSTDSDKSHSDDLKKPTKLSKSAVSTELALQVGKQIFEENVKSLKKSSAEIGVTTDVTQELLQQINCSEVLDYRSKSTSPRRYPKQKSEARHHNKINCSDLRVAELGVSTEIANMALRNKSELPVIIKSETPFRHVDSISISILNQESGVSDKGDTDEWLESTNTSLEAPMRLNWMDRRLGSLLKMPYKSFKRHILNRSSLISILLRSSSSDFAVVKRIKKLLHQEINDHQRRGMKRLYSTILRRKTPFKMGWLRLLANPSVIRLNHALVHHKRCKHFRNSHSYRCMRAKVMRIAGPTKSELAGFRMKIKSFLAPAFIKNIVEYNNKYAAIMMSQACGSEAVRSNTNR